MSTQTIERNYRKNPHTARFLQTFHTAIDSKGVDHRAELADDAAALAAEAAQDDDLLNLVPVTAPAYTPSAPQVTLMAKLILEIHALDAELGSKAGSYTAAMDRNGAWTRQNTTRWIGNMIQKSRELRAAATQTKPTAPVAEVADGRYAVEEDGVLKFFKVKNGNRPGFVFLDVQASDDWHAVCNVTRIRAILALIAVDAKAAMVRYGHELGECGRCGRTLTDAASRAAGIGPICASK
jgi:hypothetical protein